MEWLNPNNPNDRDFMVWGNPYTNEMDKTILVQRELLSQDSEIQAPLQSQTNPDWTVLLVYNPLDGVSAANNVWNKDSLIAIREFENETRAKAGYKQTCQAVSMVADSDVVTCSDRSFITALDFFADSSILETLTQEQLNNVLLDAISGRITNIRWKDYKLLFANDVSIDNINVRLMRSIITQAGPIQDGTKRYENIKDESLAQDMFVTEFHKEIRSLT